MSLIGRGRGWGGRLFEAGRLLAFSAFTIGTYSSWALIRGWELIRINTVSPGLKIGRFTAFKKHFALMTSQISGPCCDSDIEPKQYNSFV